MNRLAQLILLLHLPFYAYGMDSNPSSAANDASLSQSSSDLFSQENLPALDSSGTIADALGISDPASERSFFAGAMRFFAKRTGVLDISGASSSQTERDRTSQIVKRHTNMLLPGEEVDPSHLKQFLDRQAAAEYTAIMLLKKLQAFNKDQDVLNDQGVLPDVVRKIEQAQQLLTLHEGSTLSPRTAEALKAALEISRQFARDKLDQSAINSSDS